MDAGEALFKGALKLWRRLLHDKESAISDGAAYLEDSLDRYRLVASMLFDDALDIKPAEGVGGVAGRALLLPPHIDLLKSQEPFNAREMNEKAYLYRIAWGAVSRSLGYEGTAPGRDAMTDALCTLLAVPATREELHSQFPSTEELTVQFEAAALAQRSREALQEPGGVLESFVRYLLGDPNPLADTGSEAARDWIREAAHLRPRSDRLVLEARRLLLRLIEVSGRGDPPAPVSIWGELLPRTGDSAEAEGDDVETYQDPRSSERKVIELDRTVRLRRNQLGPREDRPLYHMFEKIETAQEYGGQSATPDASGNPAEMQDAIEDLSLGVVVRTQDNPRNLVRADVVMEPTGLTVGGMATPARAFVYPEWDFKGSSYRQDWCTVMEERYLAGEALSNNLQLVQSILRSRRRQVDEIRGHLLRTLYQRRARNRQTEGPEIDVDAMVERHADLAAGSTPPERLYVDSRKTHQEFAILLLLDASWSTDAWLEGRRVLDIELSSLLTVAEAFEGIVDEEVAIGSFRSHTRNDVRFGVLKGFRDPWRQLRTVLPSLQPDGYTRVGAAVRHATAILEEATARRKLLVLLSDGKPTDYDQYEGRYGIEDVSQAIREARARRISTFGIAIEKEAKFYLARMLGSGAYRILPRPELLPDVMADVLLGMLTES